MTLLISPAPYGWRNEDYGFGSTLRPYSAKRPHQGQDWGWFNANVTQSRIVVAAAPGTVERVYRNGGFNEGWGNRVVIRVSPEITITVNHLATGTIAVFEGDPVAAGTYLGQMGGTGDTDGGKVHLHEELYINGNRVDPEYYRTHDLPGTEGSASGGGSKPFEPEIPKGFDMSNLRIIDSPSYRGASQRVIHNGSSCMAVPAGWLQDMILKGRVDYVAYATDNELTTEVNLVWGLGGLDADTAAKKTAEMLAALK